MPVSNVAIAYHSGYGHTAVLAEAVKAGAEEAGATVSLIAVDSIDDAGWAALDDADAIIFGSPTYMGTASGVFHTFAEETSKRWFGDTWANKLAAGFTNSGSKSGDKLHTLQFFTLLAAQHGMHWVNLGLKPGWNATTASEDDINRLGFFLGAAAQTPTDVDREGVHHADIATAKYLGGRVAETATMFKAGRAALVG